MGGEGSIIVQNCESSFMDDPYGSCRRWLLLQTNPSVLYINYFFLNDVDFSVIFAHFFTASLSELATAFVCNGGQVPEQTERQVQSLAQQKSTPKSAQTLHSRVS